MKNERLEKILDAVKANGVVDVKTLMRLVYASEATVRRDLALLEGQGLILRSHGKAVDLRSRADAGTVFSERRITERRAKEKIAEAAVRHVLRDGNVVMLDASSTAMATIEFLKEYKDIIVITSGIQTLFSLAQTDLKYYSTGGQSYHKSSSFVGQTAIATARAFNADVCFVSCHGLSDTGFATDTSVFENDVRLALLQQARRRVLLIDKTKIGQGFYSNLCHLSYFDDVFCNAPLPPQLQREAKHFHLVATEDTHE